MTLRSKLLFWYLLMLASGVLLVCCGVYYEVVVEGHLIREDLQSLIKELAIWTGPAALVLIFGGLFWLQVMRRSMQPLEKLTAAARNLNTGNLLEPVARTHNGDELDQLSEAFNSMADRLNTSLIKVREFTLHASHELKTPLSILRNEMETALREESLSENQKSRISSQIEEIHRLTRIVDSLTFLTRSDAGLLQSDFQTIGFEGLVLEVFEDTRVLAREKQIQVAMTGTADYPIHGDRNRLRQMLLNLADNAVKYANVGGQVSFVLRREDARVVLEVINTGPGLSKDLQEHVFDRFFRGDTAHSRRTEGSGLGLAIVKSVVEAHRGRIDFSSIPNERTVVTVTLPLHLS